jgi:hypothetical protein
MLTRKSVTHTHRVAAKTAPLTSVVVREHANGMVTPIAAGYTAGGPALPAHPAPDRQRPLSGGTYPLSFASGGQRPRGPRVDAAGQRLPGGVGTDLTDPSTWQRPYAFPGGQYPTIPRLHFT